MPIEFFDVKTRKKVSVPESQIRKVVYHPKGTGGPRYALRADYEGRTLTKFVSKADWDRVSAPEAAR